MKAICLTYILAVFILLLFSCEKNSYEQVPSSQLTVSLTDWDQEYYQNINSWGSVNIYFSVKNTGDVTIPSWEVGVEIYIEDGEIIEYWEEGEHLQVGEELGKQVTLNTGGKKVIRVKLKKRILDIYSN